MVFTWLSASSSARPLVGRGLGHGRHDQTLHAGLRVVGFLLAEARVDDEAYAVDRQRGFRDICALDTRTHTHMIIIRQLV